MVPDACVTASDEVRLDGCEILRRYIFQAREELTLPV